MNEQTSKIGSLTDLSFILGEKHIGFIAHSSEIVSKLYFGHWYDSETNLRIFTPGA